VSELVSSSPVSEQIYCRGCGYCLQGSTSRACGECGKAFDVDERATFGYDSSHTHANERLVLWVSRLHFSCVVLWLAMLATMVVEWWRLIFPSLALLALLMLGLQTILAGRVLGYRYAFWRLAIEVIFVPVFMISLVVVTDQVLCDIRKRWQLNPSD